MTYETGRSTHVDPSVVSSRDDFADFLQAVLTDYERRGEAGWENATLSRFLDGLAAVGWARVADRDDQDTPSWRLFAEMIVAATGYE